MTEEQLLATLPDRLAQVGVARNMIGRLCEEPMITPAIEAVRRWWSSGLATLVLLGGKGCGKTFAACKCIALQRRDQSTKGYAYAPGDLPPWWIWTGCKLSTARHLAGLKAWDDEDRAELKVLTATQLLILDELGLEDGDAERCVGALLSDRIAAEKRTILTANFTPETFQRRYGERLVSRISGSGLIVSVHGPDLRAKGAA